MSLHRLDICTLTAETAWRKYLEHRDRDRLRAVMALRKHFERVDQRAMARNCHAFFQRNELDHTARGKIR
jgi:hypothetical protein